MTYTMRTRRRVLEFLEKKKVPVLQQEIRYLGKKKRQISWETLKAILHDLEDESIIKIHEEKVGNRLYNKIRRR